MRTGSIRQGGGALEDIVSLAPIGEPRRKITVSSLREKKLQHQPITCLTAYDYASARLVDEATVVLLELRLGGRETRVEEPAVLHPEADRQVRPLL